VRKRRGQIVPFESDKISRALFAATETLGRPDAFLARELTDGVMFFLAAEDDGSTLTTDRVAELTAKVVRELGQPALAEAFASYRGRREIAPPRPASPPCGGVELRYPPRLSPAEVLAACVRSYSLQSVYARDLAAAQADGLLTLTGLEYPAELEACVLGPWPAECGGLAEAVEAARQVAGRRVVLDGPEFGLARSAGSDAGAFARELDVGLRVTGLSAVVNLNAAEPPPREGELAGGPLFGTPGGAPPGRCPALADELFDELCRAGRGRVRVDWHLGASDFAEGGRTRLQRLAMAAVGGAPLAFVFDRPGRPVALAEGIDRENPAVLLTVDLHLPRLAEMAGVEGDPQRFLRKLASLARLALSAGVQKRAFLRRQERAGTDATAGRAALLAGFLLERARLLVHPSGLDDVARDFTGVGLLAGGAALEFGTRVVERVRDVLRHDGRHALMETSVDGPGAGDPCPGVGPAAVRERLRVAGRLHAAAGAGTLSLALPPDNSVGGAEAADYLRLAWQRGEVVRLRFVREPELPGN
jgi:hypothetical protein